MDHQTRPPVSTYLACGVVAMQWVTNTVNDALVGRLMAEPSMAATHFLCSLALVLGLLQRQRGAWWFSLFISVVSLLVALLAPPLSAEHDAAGRLIFASRGLCDLFFGLWMILGALLLLPATRRAFGFGCPREKETAALGEPAPRAARAMESPGRARGLRW